MRADHVAPVLPGQDPAPILDIQDGVAVAAELTGAAAELAETVGAPVALRLMAAFGGREVEVPAKAAGSVLAAAIGPDCAQAVIRGIGPGRLAVPTGHLRGARGRRSRALAMLIAGRSAAEVAAACDVTGHGVSDDRRALSRGGSLDPGPERDPR